MNIIIFIILALDIEDMMINPVLVLAVIDIQIQRLHPPAPVVAAVVVVAVIAQWTLMISEMVGVT